MQIPKVRSSHVTFNFEEFYYEPLEKKKLWVTFVNKIMNTIQTVVMDL